MGLKEIIKEIQNRTDKKIIELEDSSVFEIAEIIKNWDQKIADKKETILKENQRIVQQKIQQSRFLIKNKCKTAILQKKKDIIDEIFDKTQNELKNIDQKEYIKIVSSLLSKLPHIKDAKIVSVKGREQELKQAIIESKTDYEIAKETVTSVGGFVFKSETITVDNRFEILLDRIKEEYLLEISLILFS